MKNEASGAHNSDEKEWLGSDEQIGCTLLLLAFLVWAIIDRSIGRDATRWFAIGGAGASYVGARLAKLVWLRMCFRFFAFGAVLVLLGMFLDAVAGP